MQIKKAISKEQSRKKIVDEKYRKLFIVGLPQEADKTEIEDYFKGYGKIEDIRIIIDKMSNTSRGFGFVLFKEKESLNEVLKLGNIHDVKSYQVPPTHLIVLD